MGKKPPVFPRNPGGIHCVSGKNMVKWRRPKGTERTDEPMKKYIAEFIGTFVLVFVACGVAAALGCTGEPNAAYFLTAVAFGLVIVAMAYSIGNISGCHINPAVSIAMLVSGKMSIGDFCGYVVAQFLGAIAGAGCLRALLGPDSGL